MSDAYAFPGIVAEEDASYGLAVRWYHRADCMHMGGNRYAVMWATAEGVRVGPGHYVDRISRDSLDQAAAMVPLVRTVRDGGEQAEQAARAEILAACTHWRDVAGNLVKVVRQ